MEQLSCKGLVAVITGSSQAIGLEYVQVMAMAGAQVAALDSNFDSKTFQDICKAYGALIKPYLVDVTDPANVSDVIANVERDFRTIDICITAHATASMTSFLEQDMKNVDNELKFNFKGAFLVSQACANVMVRHSGQGDEGKDARPGSIVFTASSTAHMISHGQQLASYAASKSAIRGLVKPLAMELAKYGIRVNSISPGPIMTSVMRDLQTANPKLIEQFEAESMFGRIGQPKELHGAVILLCSPAGSWITGQDILIDGGATSWKHPVS